MVRTQIILASITALASLHSLADAAFSMDLNTIPKCTYVRLNDSFDGSN